jgi:hypothetical protein
MKIWSVLIAVCILISCKKENGNDPDPGGSATDSTWVYTRFEGGSGLDLVFVYDAAYKKVEKLYAPYDHWKNSACYFYYKPNGLLSHIVWEYEIVDQTIERASMIVVHNLNNQPVRVYYKKHSTEPANAAYYSNLNDGNLDMKDDSLVWGADNRIQEWHTRYRTDLRVVKYLYGQSGVAPVALERYNINNGVESLYDKLLLKTDSTDAYHKKLWWLGFLSSLTRADARPLRPLEYHFFVDRPSSSLENALAFVTKRVTRYSVYNNWGYYNYELANQEYIANADSSIIEMRSNVNSVQFKFTRIKK